MKKLRPMTKGEKEIAKALDKFEFKKIKPHKTDGTPCWCNPKVVSYKKLKTRLRVKASS